MKNKLGILISPLFVMGLLIMITNGCKKNENNDDSNQTSSTITDVDGNIYTTVTIGTQVWMVENLKATKYNDGTAIPNVTDASEWTNLTTGAYCNYDNTASNANDYGRLYNWYAVNTGKLAPGGWHVPSFAEWSTLFTFLGGESEAGSHLKESGITHWKSPNTAADNNTGFSSLPGGCRYCSNGTFNSIGGYSYYWSSNDGVNGFASFWDMRYSATGVYNNVDKKSYGVSVRCIKD